VSAGLDPSRGDIPDRRDSVAERDGFEPLGPLDVRDTKKAEELAGF
jgi:hypothetical protein